jgi:hypothetical protein
MSSVSQTTGSTVDEATQLRHEATQLRRERILRQIGATQAEIDIISTQTFAPLPEERAWTDATAATMAAIRTVLDHPTCTSGMEALCYLQSMLAFNTSYLGNTRFSDGTYPVSNVDYRDEGRARAEFFAGPSDISSVPQYPEWDKIASTNASQEVKAIFEASQASIRNGTVA